MNDISEISTVLSETPNNYFVYISYTEDEDVYHFEKKLQPILVDYDLQNSFYYINVTEIKKNNKDYQKDIAKELNIAEANVSKVPVILYFKDGKLASNAITSIKDFEKLLDSDDFKTM